MVSIVDEAEAKSAAARVLAVAKLREAAALLKASGDASSAEIVVRAIEALEKAEKEGRAGGDWWAPQPLAAIVRDASEMVGASVQAASEAAVTVARTGTAGVTEGLATAKAAAAKARDLLLAAASGAAGGFGTLHVALADFATNLDWRMLPTEYAAKFAAAGTQGIDRTLAEARLVWETIPEQLRALGPEEVAKRLEGFDWSHIVPHSEGGSNAAWNGIFERAGLNRARGAEDMTAAEIKAAEQVLTGQAFQASVAEVAGQVLSGAAVAAAVACVLACLEHGLAYQRGEIDLDEMRRRVARAVVLAAAVGAAVAGIMTVVALAFPAVIPVAGPLMLPLAVLGLCATGGKVVQLGMGWYEVLRKTWMRRLEDERGDLLVPGAT